MKNIHLIEKSALYRHEEGNVWRTGTWKIGESTAKELVGGRVFLHTKQDGPCFLGGTILACKRVEDGRIEIEFEHDKSLVNWTTNSYCQSKWSMEMLLETVSESKAA